MPEHTVVKQFDTDPRIWELSDEDGPMDLSGATVTMKARGPKPAGTIKFTTNTPLTGVRGQARHTPAAAHFDTVGWYDVEFLADWGGGRVRRFPATGTGFLPLEVKAALP